MKHEVHRPVVLRVQVRVQVFQASTGTLLWSESFERDIGDLFGLQAQIAREIAGRIYVVLATREQALLSRARTVIRSVRGVGFPVLAVATSYSPEKLGDANYVVRDLKPGTVSGAIPELKMRT